MKSFNDNQNRAWRIQLNIDAVRRVQAETNINLVNLVDSDPPLLTRLQLDLLLFCDVLAALLKPQLELAQVTAGDFGAALDGAALAAASAAFWTELADFFRQLRRTDLAEAIEKQLAVVQAAVTAVQQQIAAVDPENLVPATGSSSGASPARSASTPGP